MKYFGEKKAEDFFERENFLVVKRFFCSRKKDLKKGLKSVGIPFVLKVSGKKIVHKNKLNGIKTGIKNYTLLLDEFRKLKKIKGSDGVLFQQKMQGKEFFIGVKKAPEFGHVLLFGMGGTEVEKKKDLSFRIIPLDKKEIRKMVLDTDVSKNLSRKDFIKIETFIFKVSNLIKKYPKIYELDINPLMIKEGVATIVDARIVWD